MMAFTIKPNRQNIQRIKENAEKDALKGEAVALDKWTTEGGFSADETKAKPPKRTVTYNKQKPLQRRNNHPRGR